MRVVVLALLLAGCRTLLGFDDAVPPGGADDDGGNGPRDGSSEGTPLGVDGDGDGVDDGLDNCVGVMNSDQADEDADGTGDACDPCPHIAGALADHDTDGDQIGDGCDPNPNTPGDVLVRFDGFGGATFPSGYTVIGGSAADFAVTGGSLVLDTTATQHLLTFPAGGDNGWIDIVFDRSGTGNGSELSLVVDANDSVNKAFLCTIEPPVPQQAVVKLDGVVRTTQVSLGGVGPTSGRFVAGGRDTEIHCDWPANGTSVANPTVTRFGFGRVGVLIQSMHVAIHSIAIYRTP